MTKTAPICPVCQSTFNDLGGCSSACYLNTPDPTLTAAEAAKTRAIMLAAKLKPMGPDILNRITIYAQAASLENKYITGGCLDCNAHHRLTQTAPNVFLLIVEHDRTCPTDGDKAHARKTAPKT